MKLGRYAVDTLRRRVTVRTAVASMIWAASALTPVWSQSLWPNYPNNTAISTTTSGDVGIGTTAPQTKLDVSGGGSLTVSNYLGALTGSHSLPGSINLLGSGWNTTSGSLPIQGQFSMAGAYDSNTGSVEPSLTFSLRGSGGFATAGPSVLTERMRIRNDGNVGIGTSAPETRLDVGSGGTLTVSNHTAAPTGSQNVPGAINLTGRGWNTLSGSVPIQGQLSMGGAYAYTTGSVEPYLAFSIRGSGGFSNAGPNTLTERMRITNDGNIGIGTQAPQSRLDVQGDIRGANVYSNGVLLRNGVLSVNNVAGVVNLRAGQNVTLTPQTDGLTISAAMTTINGASGAVQVQGANGTTVSRSGNTLTIATASHTSASCSPTACTTACKNGVQVGIQNPSLVSSNPGCTVTSDTGSCSNGATSGYCCVCK